MSTSESPGGQGGPSGTEPPLTRRELKARGISFTTQIPAIDPLEALGGASAASHAARTEHDRVEAGRAVTEEAPGDVDGSTGRVRRPVVRAPLTATGIRTVDESGTITSVQAAVGRAVKAATSPVSWESAVSMPAVALGITDVPGRPEQASARAAGEEDAEDAGAGDAVPPPVQGQDRALPTGDRLDQPGPMAPAATTPPEEVAQPGPPPPEATSSADGAARRGLSRPLAITLGVAVVVLITVVLLLTLLSGGASALGAGPGLSTGEAPGAVGTLAVAPDLTGPPD